MTCKTRASKVEVASVRDGDQLSSTDLPVGASRTGTAKAEGESPVSQNKGVFLQS